jgi:hypothetical protein
MIKNLIIGKLTKIIEIIYFSINLKEKERTYFNYREYYLSCKTKKRG